MKALDQPTNSLIGVGLYTIPEGSRLTHVPPQNIRRWLFGYKYASKSGEMRTQPSLWSGDVPTADGTKGLSFLDLMEVRMVHAFRQHNVSWKVIREAAGRACELYDDKHPFTMRCFSTDGNRIFAEITEQSKERLYDLNKKHYVLKPIVERSLFTGIEFEQDQAARWFPPSSKGKVVLDPNRSFGQPILNREGVPTAILAKAVKVEDSIEAVAKWYEVPVPAVRAAVAFEGQLAS